MSGLGILRDKESKIEKATREIRAFIAEIADQQSFVQANVFMAGQSYLDEQDALGEGVITGYASIKDYPVTIIAQNAQVLGGSLGKAHAEKIAKAIDRAEKTNTPLISIIDSIGARLGEGLGVLEGYGSIIAKVSNLKRKVPHIAIIKGVAVGLISTYALTADIVFMGKDSVLSYAPPMVASAAAGNNKNSKDILGLSAHCKNNSTCTFAYKEAGEVRDKLALLFDYIQKPIIENEDDPNRVSPELNKQITPSLLLEALCDDKKYLELFADFATDIKVALTSINSIAVGIVQTNANGKENKLNKAGLAKIKKFIAFLQAYHIPLITLIDCNGIESNLAAELDGISIASAELAEAVALSDIAKIAVVTGSAIGYAYTALCSKSIGFDYVLAFAQSTIIPITAEVAVSVANATTIEESKDPVAARAKLIEYYKSREGNPFLAGKEGFIDNIVEPALLRPYVASILTALVR